MRGIEPVEEAVQLASRVVVLCKRPATIKTVIDVALPRPRDLDSRAYLETRDAIFESMGMSPKIGGPESPL